MRYTLLFVVLGYCLGVGYLSSRGLSVYGLWGGSIGRRKLVKIAQDNIVLASASVRVLQRLLFEIISGRVGWNPAS